MQTHQLEDPAFVEASGRDGAKQNWSVSDKPFIGNQSHYYFDYFWKVRQLCACENSFLFCFLFKWFMCMLFIG